MKDIAYPDELLHAARQFTLFDDFLWHLSPHMWTNLASEGTVAIDADGVGGIVVLTATNTDNNNVALVTTNELFKFVADKRFIAEVRLQYTEAASPANQANVAFGFADAMGADLITDNGGAAAINSSGALIYKLDGGTVWRANSENNSVVTDSISTTTAGGSAYQTLRIIGTPDGVGGDYSITYFVDGLPLRDSTNRAIKHTLAVASATEMDFGVYLKAGGTATEEIVLVDYILTSWHR